MRLIDADRAIKHYKALANIRHNEMCAPVSWADAFNEFILYLEEAPTVDAVEVVRCRDCKHWKPTGSKAGNSFSDMEYIGGCEFTKYCRRESDFCSYGERKDK